MWGVSRECPIPPSYPGPGSVAHSPAERERGVGHGCHGTSVMGGTRVPSDLGEWGYGCPPPTAHRARTRSPRPPPPPGGARGVRRHDVLLRPGPCVGLPVHRGGGPAGPTL